MAIPNDGQIHQSSSSSLPTSYEQQIYRFRREAILPLGSSNQNPNNQYGGGGCSANGFSQCICPPGK